MRIKLSSLATETIPIKAASEKIAKAYSKCLWALLNSKGSSYFQNAMNLFLSSFLFL